MVKTIQFQLNGKTRQMELETSRPLLWVLRSDLGLTGTKYGCGEGFCGSCTVLVNEEAVRSCQFPVGDVHGKEVFTIEGLASNGKLHPLQKAFMKNDALQCGFCTPGMIMAALAFLRKHRRPSRRQVIEALDDHLCRCGAHPRIVNAVLDAAEQMKGA